MHNSSSILNIFRRDRSPEGDGNFFSFLMFIYIFLLEEIDPLKGTETFTFVSLVPSSCIVRRDRSPEGDGNKLYFFIFVSVLSLEEIDPLKGTETDPND